MKLSLATSVAALAFVAGCGNSIGGTSSGGFGSATTTGGGPAFGTGTTGGFAGPTGLYDHPVVVAKTPPPAISGGTLLVLASGRTAVAADPERDQVVVVDLTKVEVARTIALRPGDEPGRLVEDAAGYVHVALRGSGSVAALDPLNGTVLHRQYVCANPRGLAYDARTDVVHAACSGGDLVTLQSTGGAPVRSLKLDSDLRDVVIDGDKLMISRFRAAEVLIVEADGKVSSRIKPAGIAIDPAVPKDAPVGTPGREAFSPAVAWRMIAAPGGGALLSYQLEQTSDVEIGVPGGYGGFCGGIVRSAVSLVRPQGVAWTEHNTGAVLPVDVAVRNDNERISIAAAGAVAPSSFVTVSPVVTITPPPAGGARDPNGAGTPCGSRAGEGAGPLVSGGQAVAVAYDASNQLLVQTRDPMLIVGTRGVILSDKIIRDTGHEIFHMGSASGGAGGLACASCHPEGREDGHTWNFSTIGARRTQTLGGGTLGTGPFHWNGDMTDFRMLMSVVFNERMSGPSLLGVHVEALYGWINQIPAWKPELGTDSLMADRGRAVFNDTAVGCANCHAGPTMTNHSLVDIGSGGFFKVPSLLGVGFRAPFMHNGCAGTLADRFVSGACGGASDKHGNVSNLTDLQKADLIAYLGTL